MVLSLKPEKASQIFNNKNSKFVGLILMPLHLENSKCHRKSVSKLKKLYKEGVPVKCETKSKRNEIHQNETKRNKSKRNGIIQNEIKNILKKKIVHCFPGYIKTRGSAH
jgi:hypothetical protein